MHTAHKEHQFISDSESECVCVCALVHALLCIVKEVKKSVEEQ